MKTKQIISLQSLDGNGETTISAITANVGTSKAELDKLVEFILLDKDKVVTHNYIIYARVTGVSKMNGSGKETTITFNKVFFKATKRTILKKWKESTTKKIKKVRNRRLRK